MTAACHWTHHDCLNNTLHHHLLAVKFRGYRVRFWYRFSEEQGFLNNEHSEQRHGTLGHRSKVFVQVTFFLDSIRVQYTYFS